MYRRCPFSATSAKVQTTGSSSGSRTHPHPCDSDLHLTSKLKYLQNSGVAPSTRLTYRSGIRAFETFCSQYDIHPILPASELTLGYFIAYLSKSLSAQNARVYLSAIRLFHLEHGHGDPLQQADLLKNMLSGLQRSQSSQTHPRQPVTVSILRKLKASLQVHRGLNRFAKRLL